MKTIERLTNTPKSTNLNRSIFPPQRSFLGLLSRMAFLRLRMDLSCHFLSSIRAHLPFPCGTRTVHSICSPRSIDRCRQDHMTCTVIEPEVYNEYWDIKTCTANIMIGWLVTISQP